MKEMFTRISALAVLVLGIVVFGCDTTTPVPSEPVQPETAEGLLSSTLTTQNLKLLTAQIATSDDVVREVIGSDGGSLELLGHTLTVRPGSVERPTLFVMTVLSTGAVVVDLQALDADHLTDTGAQGFDVPVQLALSYAGADVDPDKEQTLTIVRINDDGTFTEMEDGRTVDTENKVVTADLPSFSRYGLCQN